MQKPQATGLDTRARFPIFAALLSIAFLWYAPWVVVPTMAYQGIESRYNLLRLGEYGQNLYHFTGLKLQQGFDRGWIFASVVLTLLLLFTIFLVIRRSKKACVVIRMVWMVQILYNLAQFCFIFDQNLKINELRQVESTFRTMTIDSVIYLNSYAYAQVLLGVAVILSVKRCLEIKETKPAVFDYRTMAARKGPGKRTLVSLLIIVFAIPFVLFFGIYFLNDRSSTFIGIFIIFLAMLPFFMIFEDRRPQARELILISVMAAIAVTGRIAFFMLPQFKPITAVIIITGVTLGAEAGFLAGAVAGFVSNFFFGQGPWTPWQMFAFGIIGFLSGIIFYRRKKKNRIAISLFGALAVLLIYGPLMDIASVLNVSSEISPGMFKASLISGIPFNLIHAASTILFLFLLIEPMVKKIGRIKKKYGILEN